MSDLGMPILILESEDLWPPSPSLRNMHVNRESVELILGRLNLDRLDNFILDNFLLH